MYITPASRRAQEYACKKFHYAGVTPSARVAYNVFNEADEWCGVIMYGLGAAPAIAKPFGLWQGQVIELVRVALNGKQGHGRTSQAVAMTLRQLKKDCPLVCIVVSYADSAQGHTGTIYQATNWYYLGPVISVNYIEKHTGKLIHGKTAGDKYKGGERDRIIPVKNPPKHKYVYPLKKKYRALCKSLMVDYKPSVHGVMAARR